MCLRRLREEVADRYCANDGPLGTDAKAAVRLMVADLIAGFVHDRRLIREAQVKIAIRGLLLRAARAIAAPFEPDGHSSAPGRRAVPPDLQAQSRMIRVNVSWESLAERRVENRGRESAGGGD